MSIRNKALDMYCAVLDSMRVSYKIKASHNESGNKILLLGSRLPFYSVDDVHGSAKEYIEKKLGNKYTIIDIETIK